MFNISFIQLTRKENFLLYLQPKRVIYLHIYIFKEYYIMIYYVFRDQNNTPSVTFYKNISPKSRVLKKFVCVIKLSQLYILKKEY